MSDQTPEAYLTEPRKKRRKRNRSAKSTAGSHYTPTDQTGFSLHDTCKQSRMNEIPESLNNNSSKTSDSKGRVHDQNNVFNIENSQEYTDSVMNPQFNLKTPTTGFADKNPFAVEGNLGAKQTKSSGEPSTPPDWAIPLFRSIESIEVEVAKIGGIERSVNEIRDKMAAMDTKVRALETKVSDCEASCSYISSECEEQRAEMKNTKHEIKKLQQTCTQMKENIGRFEQERESLNDKITDLESRSMRENLVFYGISEVDRENCEAVVKNFIESKLGLDPSNITLDRAHRLGHSNARKPRPIVAKFHEYTQREMVRRKAGEDVVKQGLRGSNQGVGIQWPQQTREARRAFFTYTKREERSGNRVRITGNKLYVNNVLKFKYVDGNVVDVNGRLAD